MLKRIVILVLAICMLSSACVQAEEFVLPLNAGSAILIDGETGEVLYELNADERICPASTTKILTVFLGLLMGDTQETVTVSHSAVRLTDSEAVRIGLKAGEKVNFGELLQATLVKSGNDGANAIAEAVAGSQSAFAALMNGYAVSIGCTDTHFANASGLHDENHYTSARDMARIAFEAMQYEGFRKMAAVGRYTMEKTNMSGERVLTSHGRAFFDNPQSEYYFEGACGIKTGYHLKAGYCFVAAAERDGHLLIAAVFGCGSYASCFRDCAKLMEYGFEKK